MVLPWASHQRYAACKLAKVDPEYVDYEGDDPDTYALTVNVARRQMSKGQLAMVVAKAEGLFATNNQEYVAKAIGVSRPRVAYVAIVLKWAPELVDSVIEGASLDEAYDFAHARKVEADNAERTEADGSPWSCSDVESEVAFIIDQNIARRHLTQSQRHALAVEMAPMFETEAAARRAQAPGKQRGQKTSERPNVAGQKGDDDGRALGQAAKKMGTSRSGAQAAKKVKEKDPALFESIKAGKATTHEATTEVKRAEAGTNDGRAWCDWGRPVGPLPWGDWPHWPNWPDCSWAK